MLKSEMLLFALNDMDDSDLESARVRLGYKIGGTAGHIVKKRIITFELAAALLLGLGTAAYALGWFGFSSRLSPAPAPSAGNFLALLMLLSVTGCGKHEEKYTDGEIAGGTLTGEGGARLFAPELVAIPDIGFHMIDAVKAAEEISVCATDSKKPQIPVSCLSSQPESAVATAP